MEFVCREYARKAGVTLSDGMRLLLEQAISQRVNAVEEQAERLGRIEQTGNYTNHGLMVLHEKVDRLLGSMEEVLGWGDPPSVDESNYAPMSEEQVRGIKIAARHGKTNMVAMNLLGELLAYGRPPEFEEPPEPYWEPPVYYEGSGWE
jgi:hypothetical protein